MEAERAGRVVGVDHPVELHDDEIAVRLDPGIAEQVVGEDVGRHRLVDAIRGDRRVPR